MRILTGKWEYNVWLYIQFGSMWQVDHSKFEWLFMKNDYHDRHRLVVNMENGCHFEHFARFVVILHLLLYDVTTQKECQRVA